MNSELLYQLALTEVPNIGWVHAKILAQEFGSAEKIFKAKLHLLEKIEGVGEIRARSIKAFTDFSKAEEEIKFIEKYKIGDNCFCPVVGEYQIVGRLTHIVRMSADLDLHGRIIIH